ncbi:MAG: hypothetical protein KC422_01755 [Trueperaceae bacterium]|nr:hypothetical protein [Trueperaceae bacterium]
MLFFNALFYLCFVGLILDHLITGFISLFFPEQARRWFEHFYSIRLTDAMMLLFKPWGLLGLFAAASGIVMLFGLERYKYFLLLFAALVLGRLILRFVLAREVHERFKLSLRRNMRQVSILLLCMLTFIGKYLSL